MRNFIVTTIIALAAAKAKSHTKDKLDGQKGSKKKGLKSNLREPERSPIVGWGIDQIFSSVIV